jgi:transposase
LALGYIEIRKGIGGLAMLVQGVLRQDPFSGHPFVFRGRTPANLIKILYWDGTGLCLFSHRATGMRHLFFRLLIGVARIFTGQKG